MVTESPTSPNAIPVRTSSTGILNGHSTPTKPVLKPVPEGTWMSSSTGLHTTASLSHIRHKSDPVPIEPPKRTSSRRASRNMGLINGASWSAEKEKIIIGPYDYMADRPGKDIRRQLIHAFNVWLKIPEDSLAVITKVTGMLHTASLLVDDVEDSSELRRGIPVAHNIFGTAQTINSANYVYFLALQEIQKLSNPRAIDIFVKEMINLHRGQGMDLFWRDTLTCPSEDDYLEMVGNKTGGLFRLAIKLMQAESTNGQDYVPLVNVMGTLFQICDDYMNLSSTTYTKNKGLCEDLTEGKFSFPIIHSIRSNSQNLQLINILKQKTRDEEVKKYAIAYMESTGSFEYTRKVIKELKAKAAGMIDLLDNGKGESQEVRRVLDKMDVQ